MRLFRSFQQCAKSRSFATTTTTLSAGNNTALSATSLQSELPGTAPPHRSYIFLHTSQPPSEYPAKISTPVQRALLLKAAKWGGSVNFSWSKESPVIAARPPGEEKLQEYYMTAFSSARGCLEVPKVSLENVDEVEARLREHVEPATDASAQNDSSQDIHVYVCTHGARDCRCGDTGGAVVKAIRKELQKRRESNPADPSHRIKLAETGHVGGHKYAANVLVYPQGEWLGLVNPEDVPQVLDAILALPSRPLNANDAPLCPPHWRGRMDLSKEEQIELFRNASRS
ncbi:Sucrase/ferredoxin-like-domain-containing protein [Hygrophoropsis aurantiaca]|uniref:Sucrase/ferredoxin-like-domain-containing protein n=1 Tax=Hygrophoropsis aurantiaca TaxID=72124 RepID=A0ACB8AQQ1_9AGAM|nr:Sucrase/ferredoxin-like-domain-containing protein [Hygrophoropsis aurantiaca]